MDFVPAVVTKTCQTCLLTKPKSDFYGGKHCKLCVSARHKKQYHDKKAAGICPKRRCTNTVSDGHVLCKTHLDISNTASSAARGKQKQLAIDSPDITKVCQTCLISKLIGDFHTSSVHCKLCVNAQHKKEYEEKKATGLCANRLCTDVASDGHVYCTTHLELALTYSRAKDVKRKASGTCINCKQPAAIGHTLCKKHLAIASTTTRTRRGKNKQLVLDFKHKHNCTCVRCKRRFDPLYIRLDHKSRKNKNPKLKADRKLSLPYLPLKDLQRELSDDILQPLCLACDAIKTWDETGHPTYSGLAAEKREWWRRVRVETGCEWVDSNGECEFTPLLNTDYPTMWRADHLEAKDKHRSLCDMVADNSVSLEECKAELEDKCWILCCFHDELRTCEQQAADEVPSRKRTRKQMQATDAAAVQDVEL